MMDRWIDAKTYILALFKELDDAVEKFEREDFATLPSETVEKAVKLLRTYFERYDLSLADVVAAGVLKGDPNGR